MPIYKGSTKLGIIYHGSTKIGKVYKGATKVFGKEPIELPVYSVTQWTDVVDHRTYYNKYWKIGPIVDGYSPVFHEVTTGNFASAPDYHDLVAINGTLGQPGSKIAMDSTNHYANYTDTIVDGLGYKWHRYLFENPIYPSSTNRFYHVSPGQKVGDKVADWGQMIISGTSVRIESFEETTQTVNLNAVEGSIIYRY